jgi:phospholipase C
MPSNLEKIKTIIIVMLENRSFDHMLGYLSLPEFRGATVEGFRDNATGKDRGANLYRGQTCYRRDKKITATGRHNPLRIRRNGRFPHCISEIPMPWIHSSY